MWIFLSDAMLSIVEWRGYPDKLLVRARLDGDIQRTFPNAMVIVTRDADYLYRAVLPRDVVEARMALAVREIDYDNFKNSVSDDARHDAFMGVWKVMHNTQANEARKRGRPKTIVIHQERALRVDELMKGGMLRTVAVKQVAREFSVTPDAIEKSYNDFIGYERLFKQRRGEELTEEEKGQLDRYWKTWEK